jgi:SAM-dependent methyltransferase
VRGFVRQRRGRWALDLRANFGNLISNQIILDEMVIFLEEASTSGPAGRLLDLGAGSKPYEPLYRQFFSDCMSVDTPHSPHDTATVDVMAWGHDLPFENESFNCVICTEMLEHCPEPALVVREIARVLRPGGRAFITTPFLIPLHEMPYDFFRYTPSALRHLVEAADLRVTAIKPRGSYFSVWMGVNQMPLTKAMSFVSSRTGLPLSHPYNPLLFLLVVLPQKAYLRALRWLARHPQTRAARVHEKLTYYAGGYVTLVEKPRGEDETRR